MECAINFGRIKTQAEWPYPLPPHQLFAGALSTGAGNFFLYESTVRLAPVTPSRGEHERKIVSRRRFQKGSLQLKSGRRYGVFREDVLQPDGTFKRERRWIPLGLVSEQSERAARKQFQPYLDKANEAAKAAPLTGFTLAQFVEEWRRDVMVNLKAGTQRVAESNLRAHILPRLGSFPLVEIGTKVVQGFTAYLSVGHTKKTTLNVLATLSSIMRTA